jgi:hypothetical protein
VAENNHAGQLESQEWQILVGVQCAIDEAPRHELIDDSNHSIKVSNDRVAMHMAMHGVFYAAVVRARVRKQALSDQWLDRLNQAALVNLS